MRLLLCAIACFTLPAFAEPTDLDLRGDFTTEVFRDINADAEPLPQPPAESGVVVTSYRAELGDLHAYATPVRDDGVKRPALIWVPGGFSGTGPDILDPSAADPANDQTVTTYLQAGDNGDRLVVFVPTFRGTNGNPGQTEMFLGEADDLVAAVEHVSARPDVDPEQIYVAGHSTGGTVALIAAALTDVPAGVLCVGGAPDYVVTLRLGGYGVEPFDTSALQEAKMRSPITFAEHLKVPVLYVEGGLEDASADGYPAAARRMAAMAPKADMTVVLPRGRDHFTVLAPLHRVVAQSLVAENGLPQPRRLLEATSVGPADPQTAQTMGDLARLGPGGFKQKGLVVTDEAAEGLKGWLSGVPELEAPVVVFDFFPGPNGLMWDFTVTDEVPETYVRKTANGIAIAVSPDVAAAFQGLTLTVDGEGKFDFE
ncbi:MAG: alpha/beta fold hydrolase [Planctomycetota bacterium]